MIVKVGKLGQLVAVNDGERRMGTRLPLSWRLDRE